MDLARRGAVSAIARSTAAFHRLLVRIGWRAEPMREVAEVVVRPTLPASLAGDDTTDAVSALYAHLFRQDPVEDPRFLVGRGPELQAISDARARWEAGHSAAVLIIGERGSGKSSLLNCAISGPLDGLEVVRAEFHHRLSTPEALRVFVAGVVGAPSEHGLEEHLTARRRVVVLEEVERAFLRRIGHFEAVRELQRLITSTSRSVLWVLVTNGVAFRLLDPAVRFGEGFSHRIDAGAASADELRSAILFRHHLSGLRVRFRAAPRTRATARAQAWLHRHDPEQEFFATLAARSDRVYRTAFRLWLRHVERASDGSLSVGPIADEDTDALVAGLGLAHLFTLLAVLQHGSLTPDEHAAVFALPHAESRSQLDDLIARELLGAEQGRPGFRVRPEALPLVRQALYRRNLL